MGAICSAKLATTFRDKADFISVIDDAVYNLNLHITSQGLPIIFKGFNYFSIAFLECECARCVCGYSKCYKCIGIKTEFNYKTLSKNTIDSSRK